MAGDKKNNTDETINSGVESTKEALASEEVKANLKGPLLKIMEPYPIKEGDNISVIASNFGIENYEDLVDVNRILGVEFEKRGKNIIVKKGNTILVPKKDKLENFFGELEKIKKISGILETNKKLKQEVIKNLSEKQLKNLKRSIFENRNIFPENTKSPGAWKMGQSFIETQKYIFDEENPRIVDVGTQSTVSCANLVRRYMFYCVSSEDLTPEENEFFRKQNIDAWMLPEELISIGFTQKMNLMNNFDSAKIGSPDPIGDKEGFDKDMIKLTKYLEKSGVPNSLVPFYFKFSKFKGVVADYNKGKKNKHYNTHQSVFEGNGEKIFKAFEVKNINDGKKEPFGIDTEASSKDLKILKTKKENLDKNLFELQVGISDTLDNIISGKTEIIWTFDKIIDTKVVLDSNGVIDEDYKRFIIKVSNIENKDEAYNFYINNKDAKFSKKYPLNKASIDRIVDLANGKKKLFLLAKDIKVMLKNGEPIDRNLYKDKFSKFPEIIKQLDLYNTNLKSKIENDKQITDLELKIKESLNGKKSQPVSDFLVNFVQLRADYGSSALSDSQKPVIKENLLKFASIINIKVNGKTINLETELKKDPSKQIIIKPSDNIELSGPIMLDGLHMVNSDNPDRVKNMNARSRFLWEFIVSGVFYPSELIEPTEKSSFFKKDFGNIFSKLKEKRTYDLRPGDSIEGVLKSRIPIFEKEAFDKLDKLAPDYEQQRRNLLWYYYAQQIKALQLTGTMQSENDLNRDAANINRPIMYFDTKNIDELFSAHIKKVKADTTFAQAEAVYADYVDIISFPGDNSKRIFSRIKKKVLDLNKYKKYPNLLKIANLNDYLQNEFMVKFIERSMKSKNVKENDFFEGKVPQNLKIVLTLEEIDKILSEVTNESFHPEIDIRPIDDNVINIAIDTKQNQNLAKIIIKKESYPTESGKGKRTEIKKRAEKIPVNFIKLKIIQSFGDFQLRFDYLRNGYSSEWPTKGDLQKAVALFKKDEIKKYIASLKPFTKSKLDYSHFKENKEDRIHRVDYILQKDKIEKDLKKVDKIEEILKKEKPSEDDFAEMTNLLQELITIDSGDHSNIVGKILGASLLDDKINTHFEKLNGILLFTGERSIDIYRDKEKMQNYENTILLFNNLSERLTLYGLTENFIIRIITNSSIISPEELNILSIEQSSTGGLIYGKNTLVRHLEQIVNILHSKSNLSPSQKIIADSVNNFLATVKNEDKEILNNKDLSTEIYNLFQNPELKEALKNSNISTSLLPESDEYTGINFRNKIFRYINTME
ncbi:hypothetical protein M0P65_04770 [Candidatus Gracilibacteria bacterium]|nr:hypothetical protein [Candidatus Gracilibacteria bacterium]